MFAFNLLSDLHLEFTNGYGKFQFPATAPNLLMAGDCGNILDAGYKKFLQRASSMYENVFFILGNHEPYLTTWKDAVSKARNLASELPNVHFLQNNAIEVAPGVKLLGATLHSHIPKKYELQVASGMNDFKKIRNWTVTRHNEEHDKTKEWLREQSGEVLIGLFHYVPVNRYVSHPRYENCEDRALNTAFCTDLRDEPWFTKMHTIAFGHTHWNNPGDGIEVDGVKLISNQRGYPGENIAFYAPDKIFKV